MPATGLAVCLAACLAACSGSPGEPTVKPLPEADPFPALLTPGPRSPRIANYDLRVRFDPETHRIDGTEVLRWTNPGQRPVKTLPFHLYMNAFKNEESVFMKESHGKHRDAEASTDGWGWIDVRAVRLGTPAGDRDITDRVAYPGPDETVMEIALDEPVAPGATIELTLDFQVQLPEVFARTGYKGDFHMIGQWFPKIGVLIGEPGDEVWHCEPFHVNSEFFADFGTYDVALTVPDTHVIAATGVLTRAEDNGDGTRTLVYRAEDVHDFAWMADPHIEYIEADAVNELGTVKVRVYHRPHQRDFAERHLQAGVGSIEQFSKLYVPYPWPIMSIISPPPRAAMGAGGMEYPTLVTTAGDFAFMRPGLRMPEFVTIHEVGHNWFQGILASNEVDEAWLDEGVNEYADAVVMDALYGEEASMVDWLGFRASRTVMQQAGAGALDRLPAPIATASYQFPDRGSYGAATYTKTGLALRTLENIVGRDEFRRAMKGYARRYAYRHPTGEDFFAALEQELGRELDWFVDPAFHDIGVVAYEVRDIKCHRKPERPRGVFGRGDDKTTVTPDDAPETDTRVCRVVVANTGRVPAPVDVRIELEDGTVLRERAPMSTARNWHAIEGEYDSPVTRVTIDPDSHMVLDTHLDRRDVRTTAETAASRRAAARLGFWTQTAMQVLGL